SLVLAGIVDGVPSALDAHGLRMTIAEEGVEARISILVEMAGSARRVPATVNREVGVWICATVCADIPSAGGGNGGWIVHHVSHRIDQQNPIRSLGVGSVYAGVFPFQEVLRVKVR